MKSTHHVTALAITFAIAGTAGCAATPTLDESEAPVEFAHGIDEVRDAAATALTVTGFEIKTREDVYLEGYRPRKMGLFVGSGGESVGIWLDGSAADSTGVRVQTANTAMGALGQRNWDETILQEIEDALDP